MKDILIHQSLHGYSEGHRLLESSIKLPDEIARLMLRVSDLSGGSIFPGFEEYLTGYPITPLNLYVFARTWYAAEMPRPGCVWTHSLILQFKDFEFIPRLAHLTNLFVRPKLDKTDSKSPKISGLYSNSIRFDLETNDIQVGVAESSLSIQLSDLVNALYAEKKRNLLIAASRSMSFEDSLLRLWSQQWPSLRSNFSFCTGALSARGFAGKPFDVQFAPPQLIREITTSALSKQSQEMSVLNREAVVIQEKWIDSAVIDATLPNGSLFRNVLWSLADGNKQEDFQSFARLVNYIQTDKTISLPNLIQLVAEQFPDPSSGITLKKGLFGENTTPIADLHYDDWEILSELSVSEYSAAFDSGRLNLRSQAKKLCINSPDDAKQLISKMFRGPVNPLGEDILAGLLEGMNPEIAQRMTSEQPHFLPTLFRAKPELGISADLWRVAGDHAREMFESVSFGDLNEERMAAITEAIILAGAESLIKRALDKWGKYAVFGILNYVARSGNQLSDLVMQALTFHDNSIMEWLFAGADRPLFAKVICAHIVAPYSYKIKEFGSEIWLQTYEELLAQENQDEANYIAVLLLALAFLNASPEPVKIVGRCFEHIHQLAWNEKMPDSTWIILDPIVPHLMWIQDWDKCERLRRGIVEAFMKHLWSPEQLSGCVKNDDLLCLILQSAKRIDGGFYYFSNLK